MSIGDWIEQAVAIGGYPGIALAIPVENVFPPIPSEVILPLTGFYVSRGERHLERRVDRRGLGPRDGVRAGRRRDRQRGDRRGRHARRRRDRGGSRAAVAAPLGAAAPRNP